MNDKDGSTAKYFSRNEGPCFDTLQERLRYLAQVARQQVMRQALAAAADRIDELEGNHAGIR